MHQNDQKRTKSKEFDTINHVDRRIKLLWVHELLEEYGSRRNVVSTWTDMQRTEYERSVSRLVDSEDERLPFIFAVDLWETFLEVCCLLIPPGWEPTWPHNVEYIEGTGQSWRDRDSLEDETPF